MVAKISTGRSIYGALAYNEKKLSTGDAISLGSINSLADASQQSLRDKNRTLQRLADRNQRAKVNSVHIALSFAKDDKLEAEQLRQIAREYLDGIGFGDQPAYLYRHRDTEHDHIHIVTTNITRRGKRIEDSFIGATKSETARKAIEKKYGLVIAEDQGRAEQRKQRQQTAPPDPTEGKGALKSYARHAIRDVLDNYKPTTLAEVNALLKIKSIKLREEKGQTAGGNDWKGYTIVRTDSSASKEASPAIPASKVFTKGWGSKLEKTLQRNERGRAIATNQLRSAVAMAFAESKATTTDIRRQLNEQRISVIEHRNGEGRRYGLHFVDANGYVFKASEAGRGYSAQEWNRRDLVNTLPLSEYKELVKDLRKLVEREVEAVGYRSVAIKSLDSVELVNAASGNDRPVDIIKPYVEEFLQSERLRYDEAVKSDRRQLKDLSWGIRRMRHEYRAAVLEAAGVAQLERSLTLRSNPEIAIDVKPGSQSRSVKKSVQLPINYLMPAERQMLVSVGRYGGLSTLPRTVNVKTVDWNYWRDKFQAETSRKLERQLYRNYVSQQSEAAYQERGKRALFVELATRGILVEVSMDGMYHAYPVDRAEYKVELRDKLSAQLRREGYSEEQHKVTRKILADHLNDQQRQVLVIGSAGRDAVQQQQRGEVRYRATAKNESVLDDLTRKSRNLAEHHLDRALQVQSEDEVNRHDAYKHGGMKL